jgi:hypothetical protein
MLDTEVIKELHFLKIVYISELLQSIKVQFAG